MLPLGQLEIFSLEMVESVLLKSKGCAGKKKKNEEDLDSRSNFDLVYRRRCKTFLGVRSCCELPQP